MSGPKDILIAQLRARLEEVEREWQVADVSLAFEKLNVAELRLEAHRLRTAAMRAEALREEAAAQADICHANHEGAIRDLRERLLVAERERDEARAQLVAVADKALAARVGQDRAAEQAADIGKRLEECAERAEKAERERDEAIRVSESLRSRANDERAKREEVARERDEARAERDAALAALEEARDDVREMRGILHDHERMLDEARDERDARPDISAEDCARAQSIGPGFREAEERIAAALLDHAAKVMRP